MPNQIHVYNEHLKDRAREFRKNMTDEENRLWSKLRKSNLMVIVFLRQRPVGNYIVDFICKEENLIVEIDGGYHSGPNQHEYDAERDAYLRGLGFDILHFANGDIKAHLKGVLNKIEQALMENREKEKVKIGQRHAQLTS